MKHDEQLGEPYLKIAGWWLVEANASDLATLAARGDNGETRILIATDLGLLDGRVWEAGKGKNVEYTVTLTPWARVDARVSGSGRFGDSGGTSEWSFHLGGDQFDAPTEIERPRQAWWDFVREVSKRLNTGAYTVVAYQR